jgi:hypothetical protein
MLLVAVAMMFFVFGQIPINDAMIARYTAEEWRARVRSALCGFVRGERDCRAAYRLGAPDLRRLPAAVRDPCRGRGVYASPHRSRSRASGWRDRCRPDLRDKGRA